MEYTEFKNRFRHLPLIMSRDIIASGTSKQTMRNQLNRWLHKGLIEKLRKGVYFLNADDRRISPSRQFIANQLYCPSYVSLEYALSFYHLIPERVSDVTSVATKKTVRFRNSLGDFVYRHVSTKAYRGFVTVKDEAGLSCFMAEPEKALIDFMYFNLRAFSNADSEVFTSSYRFQNMEKISTRKLLLYAGVFSNPRLYKAAQLLCSFVKGEKDD